MRKLFYFFAITAVVLGMASCENGGEEPVVNGFQIQVEALSTKVHVMITPQNKEAFFLSSWEEKSVVEETGGVLQCAEKLLAEKSFEQLRVQRVIVQNLDDYTEKAFSADREYVAYACYVKKGEDEKGQIIGEVAFKEFKTLPVFTLPGEFAVGADKKVRFRTSNMYYNYGTYMFSTPQYTSYGSNVTNPIDLFDWNKTTGEEAILSADEWLYLFRTRSNAEKLFTHATLNVNSKEIKGLILLPDNWKTPEDIELKTDFDMGVQWDDEFGIYVNREDHFDAYSQNVLDEDQWETLEFKGAVFLPASGYAYNGSIKYVGTAGYYWTSTDGESGAIGFSFSGNSVNVQELKEGTPKIQGRSIRPVVR